MVSGLDADVQLLHRNGEFYPTNRRHFKAGTMELISPMDRLQSPLRTKSEGWMLVTCRKSHLSRALELRVQTMHWTTISSSAAWLGKVEIPV